MMPAMLRRYATCISFVGRRHDIAVDISPPRDVAFAVATLLTDARRRRQVMARRRRSRFSPLFITSSRRAMQGNAIYFSYI